MFSKSVWDQVTRSVPLCVILLAFAESICLAQGGQLDPSFGAGGLFTTTVASDARAAAYQPDGKIVVSARSPAGPILTRYNSDAAVDPTFGTGGLVSISLMGNSVEIEHLIIQSDGKILAFGNAISSPESPPGLVLARYNPDGILDVSFGTGGVLTDFANRPSRIAVLQSNGGIIVAGSVRSVLNRPDGTSFTVGTIAISRYRPDGVLDITFGSGGTVTTPIPTYDSAAASSAVLQPDGKIIVAGSSWRLETGGFGDPDLALLRYNPDGSRDTSFGVGGIVATRLQAATFTGGDTVLVQPDGRIVVGGGSVLARYSAESTIDTTFGLQGFATLADPPSIFISGTALQPDGKILVAGEARQPGVEEQHFGIARLTQDGRLDTSFGLGGIAITVFPLSGYSHPRGILLQADGRILLYGTIDDEILAMARYLADPTGAPIFTSGGLTNGASYAVGALAPDSWVDLFGENLATRFVLDANLPQTLDGTTVVVTSAQGTARSARLHFVSPQRIQFLMPAGLAPGPAALRVTNASGASHTANIEIASVAPGLFSANASGTGPAAATFLRVRADGTRSEGFTFTLDAPPNRVNVPIDLGPVGDQIYISFFGTGFRAQTFANVQIGDVAVPVPAAIAQGQFEGLDQLVVGPLPRELAGRSEMNVSFAADGIRANVITIRVF